MNNHFRPFEPLEGMSTSTWQQINPIELPIDILIPSQQYLCEHPLPEGHSFCGDEYIHVVYYKGSFWLVDGHNRCKRALDRGEKIIMARLKFKI